MTITILLVLLGSSALLSFISYQRAKRSLITQMEVNYAVAAQKYSLELTSWISTNATIIDTMAAEIAVNDISSKNYDEFHRYLKNSYDLLNKDGNVYDVYFTYPDNFMVCASDFLADGSVDFVHEREWYTSPALTGNLFYASPYLDSDTGKSIITISKAVYSENRLLGVLAADIFVDVLVDIINNANVGTNSYAFLIDQGMRMIAHPNDAYDYSDVPLSVMGVPGSPYDPLLDAIWSNSDDMVFVNDYDGVERGIAFARMTNTGWYVCIATSRDEISEGVGSLLSGFVAATIVSMVIGAVIAIILARVLDRFNKREQEYKEQVLKLEKQAADEASRAKSRFLADMSHEIRTPINAIIGMNEMILRETDSRDIRVYSRNIKQSGRNLLQLINGILDFSKIEDGKMEIVPVRYSVGQQIAYFINSISDRASAKHLELLCNIDPEIPSELYGDDTRINQIIINLLTNAVKYTEKGSVTLTVSVRVRKPAAPASAEENSPAAGGKDADHTYSNGEVLLYYEVRDTGIGIRKSDMVRLFESFERLDVIRNRNIEGTGLGMAITQNLLTLMGSELKVESTYGEGSVFSFELWQGIENEEPLGDYRNAVDEIIEADSYTESFHAPDGRILVVDDTRMNITVVRNLLKRTELKIDSALNGQDAVRLADENKYDVILMDQRMPGIDGTEAMKRIKASANGKNRNTPQICLTADVISGAKDKYLGTGFDDYLTKPVDGHELELMLTNYLPADKVEIIMVREEKEIAADSSDALISALAGIDTDVEAGLAFCGNDMTIYRSVLAAFAAEAEEKTMKLNECFRSQNWKDYRTHMHALKGASKTVGATLLHRSALDAEAAAKAEDTESIEKSHDKIMAMYAQLTKVIRENLEPEATDVFEESEDGVIEF